MFEELLGSLLINGLGVHDHTIEVKKHRLPGAVQFLGRHGTYMEA